MPGDVPRMAESAIRAVFRGALSHVASRDHGRFRVCGRAWRTDSESRSRCAQHAAHSTHSTQHTQHTPHSTQSTQHTRSSRLGAGARVQNKQRSSDGSEHGCAARHRWRSTVGAAGHMSRHTRAPCRSDTRRLLLLRLTRTAHSHLFIRVRASHCTAAQRTRGHPGELHQSWLAPLLAGGVPAELQRGGAGGAAAARRGHSLHAPRGALRHSPPRGHVRHTSLSLSLSLKWHTALRHSPPRGHVRYVTRVT